MDIATGAGLLGGIGVVVGLIMLDGGHFSHYFDKHAVIVIFGGATMATLTRFPFSMIAHGLPMGIRYAFGGRSMRPLQLIEELTRVADLMRNSDVAMYSVKSTGRNSATLYRPGLAG